MRPGRADETRVSTIERDEHIAGPRSVAHSLPLTGPSPPTELKTRRRPGRDAQRRERRGAPPPQTFAHVTSLQ